MDESIPILSRAVALLLQQRMLRLYQDGPAHPDFGICSNIDEDFDQNWDHWLEHMFQFWPSWSGSEAYPVPAPWTIGNSDPHIDHFRAAYEEYLTCALWEGPYGDWRIALLEFLITNITNQLNEGYHNAP